MYSVLGALWNPSGKGFCPYAGVAAQNSTQGFVQTHSVGVCRGRYASSLVREWHAWDKRKGSENDPVDMFGDDQLFVIFVVDNGGADLEHFEVHSFEEARSIILQVRLVSLITPVAHALKITCCAELFLTRRLCRTIVRVLIVWGTANSGASCIPGSVPIDAGHRRLHRPPW